MSSHHACGWAQCYFNMLTENYWLSEAIEAMILEILFFRRSAPSFQQILRMYARSMRFDGEEYDDVEAGDILISIMPKVCERYQNVEIMKSKKCSSLKSAYIAKSMNNKTGKAIIINGRLAILYLIEASYLKIFIWAHQCECNCPFGRRVMKYDEANSVSWYNDSVLLKIWRKWNQCNASSIGFSDSQCIDRREATQ